MGAICGGNGGLAAEHVEGMLSMLRHRGVSARSMAAPGQARLGVCSGRDRDAPLAAACSADGKVHCVLDGRLFAVDVLIARLEARGVVLDAAGPARDAQLIANAYMLDGEAAFEGLDGAFAAALATDEQLVLLRDPLGEKPLYYAPDLDGALVFASESKALLAHPAFEVEPNLDSLHRLLVFSFIPGQQTMFRGVRELLPGHWLAAHRDRPGAAGPQQRYWDLAESPGGLSESECIAELATRTRDAVVKRLPADGKVTAFLSGGLDSSAVVALLVQQGIRPICYSASFGYGLPDELGYARMVSAKLGVEHRVVTVKPDGFMDLLPTIIWSLDDPLCDCITVPNFLLAREAAREAPVVFNGEGGDPLFGGPKNKFLILGEWYAFLGEYDRAKAYLASYHKFYEHLPLLYEPQFAAQTGGSEALEAVVRPHLDGQDMQSFLNRLMLLNVRLKGGQNILVKVDKMLAAHGVEPASPLFDRDIAELAFAVPPQHKRRDDVEKYVFKKAVERLLPRAVVYRKKAGMGVPLNYWFKKTKLRGYARELLLSPRTVERGYFRTRFIQALLRGVRVPDSIGANRTGELLWMLVAIELWHRVYAEGERPEAALDAGARARIAEAQGETGAAGGQGGSRTGRATTHE